MPAAPDPGPGVDAVFARVTRRYAASGRTVRFFVAGKLRHDPVHRDVLAAAAAAERGFGEVVDIGCGCGQMGIALLEAGLARSVLGLDRAEAPLGQARHAARGLPMATSWQDFSLDQMVPAADAVLVIDVLYQLPSAAQERLLHNAAEAARQVVLIRALDLERGWRTSVTLAFERCSRALAVGPGRQVRPPTLGRLTDTLREHGFAVSTAPCWRGTPFANVLLTARIAVLGG